MYCPYAAAGKRSNRFQMAYQAGKFAHFFQELLSWKMLSIPSQECSCRPCSTDTDSGMWKEQGVKLISPSFVLSCPPPLQNTQKALDSNGSLHCKRSERSNSPQSTIAKQDLGHSYAYL
eukprot:2294518-Rhodomonas_salina.3